MPFMCHQYQVLISKIYRHDVWHNAYFKLFQFVLLAQFQASAMM